MARVLQLAVAVICVEIMSILWLWRDRDLAGTALVIGIYGSASLVVHAVVSGTWLGRAVRGSVDGDFVLRAMALTAVGVAVETPVMALWASTVTVADVRARTPELWFGPLSVGAALVPSLSHIVASSHRSRALARDLAMSAVAVFSIVWWASS